MFPQIWWLRTKENDSLPVLELRSPKSKCQQDTHTAEDLGRALPCLFQGPVASGGARLVVAPLQSLPPSARGHLPHLFVFDLALLSLSLSLWLHNMACEMSLSRDWTHAPCSGHWGSPFPPSSSLDTSHWVYGPPYSRMISFMISLDYICKDFVSIKVTFTTTGT